MRSRVLGILMVLCMVSTLAWGSNIGVEPLLNNCYDATNKRLNASAKSDVGTAAVHRTYITSNDSGDPSLANAVTTTSYKYVIVNVSCDSIAKDGGCTIKPFLYDTATTKFYGGTARTVSGDNIFVVETNGQALWVSIDNLTGSVAGLATYVSCTPCN